MSSRDPHDDVVVWCLPGGGVLPGESLEEAARREIREETGLDLDELIGPVWERVFPHTWAGVHVDSHEWVFVSHVAASAVREVVETEGGARYFEGWRWWTLEDAERHAGIFGPGRLPELLRPILDGTLPATPIRLTD